MPSDLPPIAQLVCNLTTNLPAFPPTDPDLKALHARMMDFYVGFCSAANEQNISEAEQSKVLERAQKTLWAFGEGGQLDRKGPIPCLALDRLEFLSRLKFPRPEETLALLGRLGMPVEYQVSETWSINGKLKASERIRLRSALAPALRALVLHVNGSSSSPKAAYERFLRVNPQSVVAKEKHGLQLQPDSPVILANLKAPTVEAWQELVCFLAGFEGYAPAVEFRSILHGMWAVNYNSLRGGRDLCGLVVQNSRMTVRMILYRAGYTYVKERLEEFGPVVADVFRKSYYYEEFGHQWLFVPVGQVEDTGGIKKLLAKMPELLKKN